MEPFPYIFPILGDVHEHHSSRGGLNGPVRLRNDGCRPGTTCRDQSALDHRIKDVFLTSDDHNITRVTKAIACLDRGHLLTQAGSFDDQALNLALRLSQNKVNASLHT